MKKNTILIIVIVLLWVAGGSIVYFGIFKGNGAPSGSSFNGIGVSSEQVNANQSGIVKVLPYGNTLDLDYFNDKKTLSKIGLGDPLHPVVDPDTVGAADKPGPDGQRPDYNLMMYVPVSTIPSSTK